MKCLIIGGDAAGMSAAVQIRRRQPEWKVTVLERGVFTSYAACGIPYFVAGDVETIDDLVVVTPEEFREKRGIDVRMGWDATAIDTKKREVTATVDGRIEKLGYDRLLLATGAKPILPPWPGMELEGVISLRNLADAKVMEGLLAKNPKRAVLIGAGYVGLEMAEALGRRGLDVTVVEKLSGVMGGFEEEITKRVQQEMDAHGVKLKLSTTVQGFEGADGRLKHVLTDAGPIDADVAIVSLGVRPRVELAEAAGIKLGASGAVEVDDHQRTNAEGVFAAGDCAEAWHRVLEKPVFVPLALGANRQGRVAGANMADGDDRFPGIVGSAVTRIFELAIGRCGIDERTAKAEGIEVHAVTAKSPSRAHYMPGHAEVWTKMIFRKDDGRVVGAILAGRDGCLGKRCDIFATAISAGMTFADVSDLDLSYSPPFAPVWDPVLQVANRARFKFG